MVDPLKRFDLIRNEHASAKDNVPGSLAGGAEIGAPAFLFPLMVQPSSTRVEQERLAHMRELLARTVASEG